MPARRGCTTVPQKYSSAAPVAHTTHTDAAAPLGSDGALGAPPRGGHFAMSNDANEANFIETAGHIARLKARLDRLSPEDDERGQTTEDAFDYYDRSLQLRVMQNNTQKEQLDDMAARLRSAASLNRWLRTQRAVLVLAAIAAAVWATVPEETWAEEWKLPVAAHAAGVAVVAIVIALVPIGKRHEDGGLASKMQ